MKLTHFAIAATLSVSTVSGHAAILEFNSPDADITATRDAWLAAAAISAPQHTVDFESGFLDGDNISGVTGLFGGGLVIRDTSSAGSARIEGSAGGIGGSNPVGAFALEQNERPFLELDFSAAPVDYVGFRDIDHSGTSVIITFVGGATSSTSLETTAFSGNTAEFFGIVRNDMPRILLVQLDAAGDGTWGIDNIEYGSSAVPLPAALYLLGSAAVILTGWRRAAQSS